MTNELLAEPLRQPLPDQAREDVGRAAGGEADDQPHRPRWIALCGRDARHGSERGSSGCQMQKFPTGKFHNVPPNMPADMRKHETSAVPRTALRSNYMAAE